MPHEKKRCYYIDNDDVIKLCVSYFFFQTQALLIKKCPRSVEDINDCIYHSIELLRSNLARGDLGENFTIPKLEPLFIDKIQMHRGSDFIANFKNLYVSGPSKFILKNMK